MTVAAGYEPQHYTGNGTTWQWDFNFPVAAAAEVKVKKRTAAGVTTQLVLDTDFEVNLDSDGTGNIEYPINGTGDKLPAGDTITIYRETVQSQQTDWFNQGVLDLEVLEENLDHDTRIIQELQEQLDRATLAPITTGEGEEALTQADADLLYVNIDGDTMTGDLGMGTHKVTGLGAGAAATDAVNKGQVDTLDAAQTAKFHTTTGHHHDGSDAKKVVYSDIDAATGSPGVGSLLTVHTGGVVQAHAPMAASQAASTVLTSSYQDICTLTMVVPRAATYVGMFFSMQVSCTVPADAHASVSLKFFRDATELIEMADAFHFGQAAGASQKILVMPVAVQHVHQPGAAGTPTLKVQAKLNTGSGAVTLTKSGLLVIMWG